MPDMRRLVRVDAGVFDDDLLTWPVGTHLRRRLGAVAVAECRSVGAVQKKIEVSGAGHPSFCDTVQRQHLLRQLFGNLSRRLSQRLCQLKTDRRRDISEIDPWRRVQDRRDQRDPEGFLNRTE